MKKLTIPNIDEKLKGEKILEYVVQSIGHDPDSYVINCVDSVKVYQLGVIHSLTIHLIRDIHADEKGELVKVWMRLHNGKRTAVFRMWIENIQSMEDWISGIEYNIQNRGWY
jgi:hypothetical protein